MRYLCLKLTISLPSEEEEVRYGSIQQIFTSGERPPGQNRNDSRLVRDQIDLELVKCWLDTCKQQHNSMHLQRNSFRASFLPTIPTDIHDPTAIIFQPCQPTLGRAIASSITLIDIKRECLIDMPSRTAYVALSYVWGGPQHFQNNRSRQRNLYNPGSITVEDEAIPRTIQDAIWLAAQLGAKYLWVDSLCICQDDIENKMNQIANMGIIYSQALFTIIAASGSNASAGLPGVRAFSRNSVQHIEHVQGMVLANELSSVEDIIPQSYWSSRGWTYQEKELSTRHLIFCKSHAFFQCNQTIFKEDSGLRNHGPKFRRARRLRGDKTPIWNSYQRAVVEYTKRNMSDESDIINAFQGVLNLLQPAFRGEFLFGLPETELDAALLWQPTSVIRRRVDPETKAPLFPSWSWAGWVGEVAYRWTRHQLDDISRVYWQSTDSESGNSRFCTSNELRAPRYGDHDGWQYVPNSRGPPYYYQHGTPEIWCLHPVAPKDERSNYILIQPGTHRLIFKAYTAFFRISPIIRTLPGTPYVCGIFDRDGFQAGRMYMTTQCIETLKDDFQELVCLSRRRYGQMDEGPAPQSSDDFSNIPGRPTLYPCYFSNLSGGEFDPRRYNMHKPWSLYNVMMIGWDKGVAYRIAIGLLNVTAFVQAKPVKKVITLA